MGRLLVIAIAALATAGAGAAAPSPTFAQEQPSPLLSEIEREVMCPVCGIPLELAHEAPQARQQRRMIQNLIDEGRSKEEIKDALVAEYGEEVLAVPGTSGFDLTAWLVPGAAIVLAAGAIIIGLRRWRRATAAAAEGPGPPDAAPLDPEDAKRVDADLGRYEL
jgi:cytochrome c-type biogenesis protein CcmH